MWHLFTPYIPRYAFPQSCVAMTQAEQTKTDKRQQRLVPGALLGGFGDPVVPEFAPLLPATKADEETTELANKFIETEKIFTQFTPSSPGFNRFYQLLIQAHAAMMLDAARASNTFEMMEAVTAHMAHIIADYAITAARPSNEPYLRDQLAKNGHTAVASIFSSLAFIAQSPTKSRMKGERPKNSPRKGKRPTYAFPFLDGLSCHNIDGHNSLGQEPNNSVSPHDASSGGFHVEGMEGLVTSRSPSQASSDSSIWSTPTSCSGTTTNCDQNEGEPSPISTRSGIAGVGRLFKGQKPLRSHADVRDEEEGWNLKRDPRFKDNQSFSAKSSILSPWNSRYDSPGSGRSFRLHNRPEEGLLSSIDGPQCKEIPGDADRKHDNRSECFAIRPFNSPICVPKANSICGKNYQRAVGFTCGRVFGRLSHCTSVSGISKSVYAQGPDLVKLFGSPTLGEEQFSSLGTAEIPGSGLGSDEQESLSSVGEASSIFSDSSGDPQWKEMEQIYPKNSDREVELYRPRLPTCSNPSQRDAESLKKIQQDCRSPSRGEGRTDVVEKHIGFPDRSTNSKEAHNSNSQHGCIEFISGLHNTNRKSKERDQVDPIEHRGKEASHKLQGTFGCKICPEGQPHIVTEETDNSMDRQRNCCSSSEKTRVPESGNKSQTVDKGDPFPCRRSPDNIIPKSPPRAPKCRSGSADQTINRVVGSPENSGLNISRSGSAGDRSVCHAKQHSPPPVQHKRVGCARSRLEGMAKLDCSSDFINRRGDGQNGKLGSQGQLSAPITPEESGSYNNAILVQDQLGFKALQSSIQEMDISSNFGGGLFDGRANARQLESEISSKIDRLARSVEFRTCSPGTRDRRIRLVTKFFQWCIKEANTISVEDTILLYCYRSLGIKSEEQIHREVAEICSCLKLLEVNIKEDLKKKIQEIAKYCNLVYPPEGCEADPVTLSTIFELMDRTEDKGITFVQGRALDILLVAYPTMSRLGEIAQLEPQDVKIDENGTVRISVITKTLRRKGLKTEKLVPRAVAERSWCPCNILLEWLNRAKEGGLSYVFANDLNLKPTVTSVQT